MDEILTEIRIPFPPPKSGGAYFKLERKVGDFATAAVAVQITLDGSGAYKKVGIGLTNVGGTPIRAKAPKTRCAGRSSMQPTIGAAAQAALMQRSRALTCAVRWNTKKVLSRSSRSVLWRGRGTGG